MNLKHQPNLSWLWLTLMLASCQRQNTPIAPPTTVPIAIVPTAEATLAPSMTPIAPTATATILAVTATIAPTATPSLTPTPRLAPTLTPLPTLTGEELEIALENLLANPMNCDVPCWWGAIPGITQIGEFKHQLDPYNFDMYEYQDYEFSYLRLGIGYVEERNDFAIRIGYRFSGTLLSGVSAYAIPIADVLARYGQPDEIWFTSEDVLREEFLLMRLNLVYFGKGIVAGYLLHGTVENEVATTCLNWENDRGSLRLVVPNTITNYQDFSPIFERDRRYLPLAEATSITVEEFMEMFSNPDAEHCLQTPISLWQ